MNDICFLVGRFEPAQPSSTSFFLDTDLECLSQILNQLVHLYDTWYAIKYYGVQLKTRQNLGNKLNKVSMKPR